MTNQIQGQMIFAGWEGTADDEWVYTPWMPVLGDIATFGVEVIQRTTGIDLKWEVQTRALDSSVAITTPVTTQTASSIAVHTAFASVKTNELYRYRFSTGTASESVSDRVIFRALQPSWQMDRR